eukprot:scaffold11796_cov143-Skeletonema_marinoi.AAC.4
MVRRIVKCGSCLKRFATASGQDLCPTCRTKVCNHNNILVTSAEAPPTNNLDEEEETIDALQSQQRPLVIRDVPLPAVPFKGKKRKLPTATTEEVDVVQVCNNVAAASPAEESRNDENDTTVKNDGELKLIDTNKAPVVDVISKKPKTGNDEGEIALSNSTVTNSLDEDESHYRDFHVDDDNDDLRCVTNDGSNTDLNDKVESDEEANNQHGDGSCCGSENDDLFIECIEIDDDSEDDACSYQKEASEEVVTSQSKVNRTDNNPENDVCYICGSNLSGKGFKSRVAHMKRCSTKFGQTMKTSSAEVEEDMMVPLESSSKAVVSNPYKTAAQWHGNAGTIVQQSKEKQSMLKHFFKAPVRSLTNVLMAGSRQSFKKKVEETSSQQQMGLKSGTNNTASGKKPPFRKGSWASNNRRNGQCPSYKRIPGTDFLCDGFYYAGSLTQNYFLTHFHSDHYGGITKKWNEGIIYCSEPTANLVHQNLGVEQKYLHPLPMNEPTIVSSKDKAVKVTLLDANHCPGAVMFLFEVGNRRILHVGDFRWNRNIMLDIPQIRALSALSPRLDELFLDTTYCNPKYELPTQEEAIAAAIDVASEEMEKSKRGSKTLFLFGAYTIGKEKIYLSVAQHLKKKIYVDSRRLRILKALGWPKERMSIFTTKKEEACLWIVPLGKVNFKDMPDFLEQANNSKAGKALTAKYERVVGFRPTGWTFSAKDKKQTLLPCGQPKPGRHLISSKTNGKYSVHGVPYSEHSSFPELVDCVHCLKPRKIVTTVSVSKSEEQIEMLLNAANALD